MINYIITRFSILDYDTKAFQIVNKIIKNNNLFISNNIKFYL